MHKGGIAATRYAVEKVCECFPAPKASRTGDFDTVAIDADGDVDAEEIRRVLAMQDGIGDCFADRLLRYLGDVDASRSLQNTAAP